MSPALINRFRPLCIEPLENRRLLTDIAQSQLFLYLLNEARHDPPAYQLANAVAADLTGVAPRQPLAVISSLMASAQFHSTEMATSNYFDHQSQVTGQWPNANARAQGYNLPTWFPDDQNYIESIAAGYSTAAASLKQLVESPPHRTHLLGIDPFYAANVEGGIGYAFDALSTYQHYWSVHLARTEPTSTYLTGVVFNDSNNNGRYDLNEGQSGVPVQIGAAQVLTNAAGGWSLPVAAQSSQQVSIHVDGNPITTTVNVLAENRQLDVRSNSRTVRVDFGNWLITPSNIVGSFVNHFGYSGPGSATDTGKILAKESASPTLLTYNNLINTTRGINGLLFDIDGLLSNPTAADFQFQMSPQFVFDQGANPPSSWGAAPPPVAPPTVTPGSPSRVVIQWADNAIANRWLRVTVKATANTGLAAPEVYYIGHLLGETTGRDGSTFSISFGSDLIPIRAALAQNVNANSTVDIDKNGLIQVADIIAMRANTAKQLTQITIPATGGGGGFDSIEGEFDEIVEFATPLISSSRQSSLRSVGLGESPPLLIAARLQPAAPQFARSAATSNNVLSPIQTNLSVRAVDISLLDQAAVELLTDQLSGL